MGEDEPAVYASDAEPGCRRPDDDGPSFADLPFPIQEKFLSQLQWSDVGGAASTCAAWRDYFHALDDVPTWKSTFTVEPPPTGTNPGERCASLASELMSKLRSPSRPDLCVFFASQAWSGALGDIGDAIASQLPASCAVAGGVAFGVIGTDTATGHCVEIEDGPGLVVAVLHLPRDQPVRTCEFLPRDGDGFSDAFTRDTRGRRLGVFLFGADQRRMQAASSAISRREDLHDISTSPSPSPSPSPSSRSSVTLGGMCGVSRSDELYHRPSNLASLTGEEATGKETKTPRENKNMKQKGKGAEMAETITSHALAIEEDSDSDDSDDSDDEDSVDDDGAEPSTSVRRSSRISSLRAKAEEEKEKNKKASREASSKKPSTTSGCLVIAFSGSRDGELSLAPAVTRGAAPHGPKFRVLRSSPGDEPGIQWIFEVQQLPPDNPSVEPADPAEADSADDGAGGGGSGAILSAEQLIHAVGLGHVRQPLWLGCRSGVASGGGGGGGSGGTGEGTAAGRILPGAASRFEMLDIVGFDHEAELNGETKSALVVSVPSPLEVHAAAFAANDDGGGAVVQFHSLSAAASRTELVSCAETMKAALKREDESRDAAAAAAAAAADATASRRRPRQRPLGAFAAVCNGRGEAFHGPEHPAADTTAFRRGFGPDADVPVIGFFANGELGPGAAGEASGAAVHRSKMMGFTSVFGVLAPLGPQR